MIGVTVEPVVLVVMGAAVAGSADADLAEVDVRSEWRCGASAAPIACDELAGSPFGAGDDREMSGGPFDAVDCDLLVDPDPLLPPPLPLPVLPVPVPAPPPCDDDGCWWCLELLLPGAAFHVG